MTASVSGLGSPWAQAWVLAQVREFGLEARLVRAAARVGTGEGIGVFGLGSGVGDGVATGFAVSVCDGDAVTAVTSNGYNCFAEPR